MLVFILYTCAVFCFVCFIIRRFMIGYKGRYRIQPTLDAYYMVEKWNELYDKYESITSGLTKREAEAIRDHLESEDLLFPLKKRVRTWIKKYF